MRIRSMAVIVAAVFLGAMLGQLLAPQPAGAVSREIIELQQTVGQILQGQTDLRSSMDQRLAELRTLIGQSADSQTRLVTEMSALQKTVQDSQANSGARMDSLTTQSQGVSDNMQDMQARVGKLSQQLTDVQNLLQSIDAKLPGGSTAVGSGPSAGVPAGSMPMPSGGAAGPGANTPNPMAPAPISSDTLYQNALRDFTSGRYDLSRQEFNDFLKNFPSSELAGNAQFYLGEISYAQADYPSALTAYEAVIANYPSSYKLAAASLRKGEALLALGEKASAARQFRTVVTRFPGTDESKRAEQRLRALTPHPTTSH
ncbi:MAG: tol-pal system protein YbgF [Candidatus Acidiferrales bacterium]